VGDANVVGVCAILKRLRKHKTKGYRNINKLQPFDIVQDAMMNGESMMSLLRKRAMEGLGEVIESVEDKAIQQGTIDDPSFGLALSFILIHASSDCTFFITSQ